MQHTLESFAAACREILRHEDSPAGRVKVATLLKEVLRDQAFIAPQFGADSPERKLVYEDPQLGFCILAHEYRGPKDSAPHDHGPSWAIYGQVSGETMMSDWTVVEPAAGDGPGKVRKTYDYKLVPGDAHVYNEGDVHSPSRAGPTRLIRIEGTNMERVARSRFEPAG
jgi:predicted metal-dependent enzyme (double-stranded beta helix superfamily)